MDSGFLLGRSTAGAGSAEEITVGSGLSLSGGTLSSAGVSSFSAGTTGFTPNTATTGDVTLAGTLAVANGGTGVTTSTGTGSVVLSTSPTLVTPALGTPSSGVVTNLTGTASININGTVGATTPTTGAFTTISASSTSTLTGNVGIGGSPTVDALRITGTASGSTFINGQVIGQTVGSGVTDAYRGVLSRPILQNATFTLTNLYHFYANPQTKPASPTLTNQYGYHAETTLTDATNNYGFYGAIASGTGRWNVYAAGTAPNYFAGVSTFNAGIIVSGSVALNGSTSGTVTVSTAAAAGTWTLTLPTSAGTNGYVLSTNGAGVTSWVAQSGGGGGGATAGDNIFLANNFGGF